MMCWSDSLELGELDLDGEGGCKFLHVMCWSDSLELGELDLDGEGGCKFLRVMLSLIMHNYPQLVYGALELLFRHFSQRQEVLQAFKQASTSS